MALTEASPRKRTVTAIGPKFPITLSGTVIAGDLIGYSSGWKRALATTGTAIVTRFVALEGGVSGDVIEVASVAVVGGFTGGTLGGAVYNEEGAGVGGGYTESAPVTGGDVNVILGYIISATEVHLLLGARVDSTG
jgi:hypothetical protein